MAPKTFVYIDGFNLYYGALKNTAHRWLDLLKLCQRLLPDNDIQRINYYTALVKARPYDVQQPIRQAIYLRAIKTIPCVNVHLGHYLSHRTFMAKATPPPNTVEVIKTEEKGSDVNLASHLLADGFSNEYEVAVVISNDSDLREPVRIVSQRIKKGIGVVNPQVNGHPSQELKQFATFFRQLRTSVLPACQFPPQLTDATGTFTKPASW
jgi:uncharacterized LabA/DUF88 family protein